jgi:formamidopyrimidine-DNA glycosylase
MPELPEVQTVVNVLAPRLEGKTLKSIHRLAGSPSLFSGQTEKEINRWIQGQTIQQITRRAKYIVWRLDKGMLLIHLRMTGRLVFTPSAEDNPRHFTARFHFTDGSDLWFKDYRKFGRITYISDIDAWDATLGPEPLSSEFTRDWLRRALQNRNRQIKPLLLDQTFLAGLGNIYVDEALWAARIHPQTIAAVIGPRKVDHLHQAIRRILAASIEEQGTTIINFYFGEGKTGNFRNYLQVFGRENKPCNRCGTAIQKIRVAQRGTHLCPKCQRKP